MSADTVDKGSQAAGTKNNVAETAPEMSEKSGKARATEDTGEDDAENDEDAWYAQPLADFKDQKTFFKLMKMPDIEPESEEPKGKRVTRGSKNFSIEEDK